MNEVFTYLPVLAIVMVCNIALGMYSKIGVEHIGFDRNKFINGIIKAVIIGGAFVGLTYCFTVVDLSSVGIEPMVVMFSAIVIYAGKAVKNLATILGVKLDNEK